MQASVPRSPTSPQLGLFSLLRRLLFGDRAKRAHISDHGAFMRVLSRAWAVPMTLVFSFGALITLASIRSPFCWANISVMNRSTSSSWRCWPSRL
jgi:hypothetical protein